MPHPNKEDWLPLKQAAERLGVHATTLRRWADSGELPTLLTPGRHRRFAIADLDRFAEEHRRLKTITGLERIWAEQALIQTRKEIIDHPNVPWLAAFNEEDRERKRALGRRLMGLMLQYVSLSEGGDDILEEARVIGREHAEVAKLADARRSGRRGRKAMWVQVPPSAHKKNPG